LITLNESIAIIWKVRTTSYGWEDTEMTPFRTICGNIGKKGAIRSLMSFLRKSKKVFRADSVPGLEENTLHGEEANVLSSRSATKSLSDVNSKRNNKSNSRHKAVIGVEVRILDPERDTPLDELLCNLFTSSKKTVSLFSHCRKRKKRSAGGSKK